MLRWLVCCSVVVRVELIAAAWLFRLTLLDRKILRGFLFFALVSGADSIASALAARRRLIVISLVAAPSFRLPFLVVSSSRA